MSTPNGDAKPLCARRNLFSLSFSVSFLLCSFLLSPFSFLLSPFSFPCLFIFLLLLFLVSCFLWRRRSGAAHGVRQLSLLKPVGRRFRGLGLLLCQVNASIPRTFHCVAKCFQTRIKCRNCDHLCDTCRKLVVLGTSMAVESYLAVELNLSPSSTVAFATERCDNCEFLFVSSSLLKDSLPQQQSALAVRERLTNNSNKSLQASLTQSTTPFLCK